MPRLKRAVSPMRSERRRSVLETAVIAWIALKLITLPRLGVPRSEVRAQALRLKQERDWRPPTRSQWRANRQYGVWRDGKPLIAARGAEHSAASQ
jgi:hypothetical protein